jgi:hypothetical protein
MPGLTGRVYGEGVGRIDRDGRDDVAFKPFLAPLLGRP